MRIPDFLRMNDWNIRRFIIVTLSILVAYDGIFLTNKFLFKVPILPQLLGFIVLTFIPGFIILRILKVHNVDRVINILLAIGLSLSFIMIFGLAVDIFFQYIGIAKPISTLPLLVSFSFAIVILSLLSYIRDRDFRESQPFLNVRPLLLFPFLMLFLSIFGAYLMTMYGKNEVNILLLLLISVVPLIVIHDKIPKELYSILIFAVSLSLLYHTSLISIYVWGSDQFFLTYYANQVIEKGVWKLSEGVLPLICILAPVYSLLCDLSVIWVFKIIFPFIYSLMPLVLYYIYKKFNFCDQPTINEKFAVLSVFIPVFFYVFYRGIPMKQCIAKLFMAFVLMLMFYNLPKRFFLALIMSLSLIFSHYGVSYFFAISLVIALIISYILKYNNTLSLNFVILYISLAITWYMYVSSGYTFNCIVHVGVHILRSLSHLFRPEGRTAVTYATMKAPTILWNIYKIIHILLQLFIAIGMLRILFNIIKGRIKNAEESLIYTCIISFYIFYIFGIVRSFGMGFDRIFDIVLVLLSPLAPYGCIYLVSLLKASRKIIDERKIVTDIFALFLVIFLLFNSGVIFVIAHDKIPPYAIALNKSVWDSWGTFTQEEVCGAMWIVHHSTSDKVSTLPTSLAKDGLILSTHYKLDKDFVYYGARTTKLPPNICIYLSRVETKKKVIPVYNATLSKEEYIPLNKTIFYNSVLLKSDKIYYNGGSTVYYTL